MNGRSRILAGGLVGFAAIALVAILLRASWSGAPSARVAEAQPAPAPAITLVGPDEAPAHDADAESSGGVEVKPSDEEASATEPEGETEESEAEEHVIRDQWFMDQRTGKKHKVPKGTYQKARAQAAKLVSPALLATDPLTWSQVGPNPISDMNGSWHYGGSVPYGGRVTAIANDPTSDQIAYVGTAMGGVWKTVNAGKDWTPIFDGDDVADPAGRFPSLSIGAVAIDPNANNTVYVGTGEANNTGGYFGTGLYKSTDGGEHWSPLAEGKFNECGFSSIVVSPISHDVIIVGVVKALASVPDSGSAPNPCAAAGIYWTSNGGLHAADWSQRMTGEPNKIIVAPNAAKVLYAGLYGSGIWRSPDSGFSWSKIALNPVPTNPYRVEVAAAAAQGLTGQQALYVAVSDDTGEVPRVYFSPDSGATWKTTQTPLLHLNTFPFCNGQCKSYDLAVAVAPSDPTQAFVGGSMLNGLSNLTPRLIGWGIQGSPSYPNCPKYAAYTTLTSCLHVDMHVLTFDKSGNLWVGSDGGVWRTSNPKATTPLFTNLNENLHALMYYPGIAGSLSTQLLAGAQDNGASRMVPGTSDDGSLIYGGDGAQSLIVGSGSTGLAITSVQFGSMVRISSGLQCGSANHGESGNKYLTPFAAPLVAGPAAGVAYAGSTYVWQSRNTNAAGCLNGATTWSIVSPRFYWNDPTNGPRGNVYSLAAAAKGDLVYAGMQYGVGLGSGEVYVGTVSTFGTTNTWANRSGNLPNKTVTDFWVSRTDSQIAYLTMSGWGNGHVWKTTNAGVSWSSITGDLPDSPANAITIDTRANPAIIYVGTDVGVFWAQDGTTTWHNTNENIPPVVVHDLLLDTTSNQLIAATFGRGLWKAPALSTAPPTPPAPANDNFASPAIVAGLPYTKTGIKNDGATTQSGEDLAVPPCTGTGGIGKTVWFRYTPSQNVSATIDTIGSDYDTIVTVFRGTALTALTQLACDDDSGGNHLSRITSFPMTAGQTYDFQVGGFIDPNQPVAVGNLTFNITVVGPSNDAFGNASLIGSLPFQVTKVDTTLASTEPNEPTDPGCNPTAPITDTLWYKYMPASTVTVTASTVGSTTTDGVSKMDTVLGLYRGTAIGALTKIACDDDSGVAPGNAGASRITGVTLTGGQTYYFQVGGFAGGLTESGLISFDVKAVAAAPTTGGDAFANATPVTLFPYSISGISTASATVEQGEDVNPSCVTTGTTGATLWYKLTPANPVNITIDLSGSTPATFDTVAVLYQGTSLGGLAEIACDDDSAVFPNDGGASRITAVALAGGQTYYLQVGGFKNQLTGSSPSTGALTLKIGDINSFASAATISQPTSGNLLSYAVTGLNTTQADEEPNENLVLAPCAGTGSIGKTVWFRFTPATNMTITANTQGSGYDTVLTLFRGTAITSLTELNCDDDGIAGTHQSVLSGIALTAGQTYYFQVGGWQGSGIPAESGTLLFTVFQN